MPITASEQTDFSNDVTAELSPNEKKPNGADREESAGGPTQYLRQGTWVCGVGQRNRQEADERY